MFGLMKKVLVGSKNPVKLNATKQAFKKVFPEVSFSFDVRSVESGVSDQPMGSIETYTGALNRVNELSQRDESVAYYVGIEGGIELVNGEMEVFAWVVIKDSDGRCGKSKTGTFYLPKKIVELVESGKELGSASDIVFGESNLKQKAGTIGKLTKGIISREKYYVEAVVLALVPFVNASEYFE